MKKLSRLSGFLFLFVLNLGLPQALCRGAYALEEKCGPQLYPVDEAAKDPSFLSFRQGLLHAIEIHDSKLILSLLDPKILNDFGGTSGTVAFQKKWHPTQANSPLWKELKSIMRLGGTFEKDENQQSQFIAPYVFSRWCISMDCEGCDYRAVIDKEVTLRAGPKGSAAAVARLSYDIVKTEGDSGAEKSSPTSWIHVSTLKGQKGYVPAGSIRSPTDYRAIFTKINGEWKMTALVSGD